MSVPNQKKIFIKRDSDNARVDYLKVSNDNLKTAMYSLNPSAFMLWIYFVDNSNGYNMELYPVDFMSITGLSDSTYRRAFKELEEKGYLIKSTKKKNYYLFKEKSEIAEQRDEIETLDLDSFNNVIDEFFK